VQVNLYLQRPCGFTELRLHFVAFRYEYYDIYMSEYLSDFKNWDLAIITLQQPVGLAAGWMGVKAFAPKGACSAGALTLSNIHVVGYPVETSTSSYQYTSSCSLQVCLLPTAA
jgi:hypothetical protein